MVAGGISKGGVAGIAVATAAFGAAGAWATAGAAAEEASPGVTAAECPAAVASQGVSCCGGRDRWVRSLGAIQGRRRSQVGDGVGGAGSCKARACRHVLTSGGRRQGEGGEGRESHCAGLLR